MSARTSFTLDLNRCTGCHACEMACQLANSVPGERRWRRVRTLNELHVPGVEVLHLSLACNHCAAAPCLEQCPARAYHRDRETGAVLVDEQKCLGCGYCAWACPYGAPHLDTVRGVMAKCDFCVDRLHQGLGPACATACPTGALGWAELAEHELVHEVPGFAQADTGPAIRIIALKPDRIQPELILPPALPPWQVLRRRIEPLITLTHEWTLAVFTILTAALVGIFGAALVGGPIGDWPFFLAAGLGGLGLSAWHLGRRDRAWRAPLHLDRSWLSREVLLCSGFLGAATLLLATGSQDGIWGWAVAGLGLLGLLAVDMVYRVAVIRGSGLLHSAQVTGTGLLLATVLMSPWPAVQEPARLVALTLGLLKLVLYLGRKLARGRQGLDVRPVWSTLRAGLLLGGLGIWFVQEGGSLIALTMIWIAELIDRGEFYSELEITTPDSLLLDELASRPEAHGLAGPEG